MPFTLEDLEIKRKVELKEKPATSIQYAIIKMMLMMTLPFIAPALVLQILYYYAKLDVWMCLMITVMTACGAIMLVYTIINRTGAYLHGREMLILTFREAPGDRWSDFVLIDKVKPVGIVANPAGNPGQLYEYEVSFEDFPLMDRMLLLAPCPWNRLLIPTAEQVFFRGLVVGGTASYLGVTKVREFELEGERIPVVISKDSDFDAEVGQKLSRSFDVTPEIIESAVMKYDAFLSIPLKHMLMTRDAQISGLLESTKDFEGKVQDSAAKIVQHYIEFEKEPSKIKGGAKKVLKNKIFWIGLGIAAVLIIVMLLAIGIIKIGGV